MLVSSRSSQSLLSKAQKSHIEVLCAILSPLHDWPREGSCYGRAVNTPTRNFKVNNVSRFLSHTRGPVDETEGHVVETEGDRQVEMEEPHGALRDEDVDQAEERVGPVDHKVEEPAPISTDEVILQHD